MGFEASPPNEFRASLRPGGRRPVVVAEKYAKGDPSEDGLRAVKVPRSETRRTDQRGTDRHRLGDEQSVVPRVVASAPTVIVSEWLEGVPLSRISADGTRVTKATFPTGAGPNDKGSSRYHLVRACEASLRRLGHDTVVLLHLHNQLRRDRRGPTTAPGAAAPTSSKASRRSS